MARTYQDAVAFTDKVLAVRKRPALSFKWSTPRFSLMGSRPHRLRLLDWLEQDHVERDGSSLLLGSEGEPERIVINLLKIGLLKQHLRGHHVIGALVQELPPRVDLDQVAAAKQGNEV